MLYRNESMTLQEARHLLNPFPTFGLGTIRFFQPGFAQQSLARWKAAGRIVPVAPGHYILPDSVSDETDLFAIANSVYNPSYVSLETALSIYGLIPETVHSVTSVATRKTRRVESPIGSFSYRSFRPDLFFGYVRCDGRRHPYLIARPEKAVLDFLYLNPSYDLPGALLELRLDPDAFAGLSRKRLDAYCRRFGQRSLARRLHALREVMRDA
jgi:predicted transcriptional regulator of viral defense system